MRRLKETAIKIVLFLRISCYTANRELAVRGDTVEKLNAIREQVIQLCDPQKILLFGSQAKGTATAKSDIDLCIIASTNDKRSLLTDLYCDTESDTPIDFLLYTPEEWEHSVADSQSFAHKLNREGVVLYG